MDAPNTGTAERARASSSVSIGVVVAVVAAGVIGLVLRILTLRSVRGGLNADEAYTGIESFEVLAGRFPVVLGGTAYTAVFEAYLFAPVVALFGSSIVTLKVIPMIFWALAAVAVARATIELAPRAPVITGLLAGALVWITPGTLLLISTQAFASYASGLLVIVLVFLLGRRMIDDQSPPWQLAALTGLLAGIGVWMHPMFLSVIIPVVAFCLLVHRTRTCWVAVIAGGVIGSGPFLIWNVVNGFPSRTLPMRYEGGYLDRLGVFVSELLPRAFGLRDENLNWIGEASLGKAPGWMLYALLIALAAAGAISQIRHRRRPSRWLLATVLIAVLPIMALFPPLIYSLDGRYGLMSFPFVTIAVALGVMWIAAAIGGGELRPAVAATAAVAMVILWLAGYVLPTAGQIMSRSPAHPNAALYEIDALLAEAGIEHIYGSYWRVYPLEFVANRRLDGAVLAPLPVRFPERQAAVFAADPNGVAWVLEPADDQPDRFDTDPLWLGIDRYERIEIGTTVIYLPRD